MKEYEQFKLCTDTLFDGDLYDIECILGLWSVSGSCKATVEDEALHYFSQYKSDGEYYEILGGNSPLEVMRNKLKGEK